MFFLDGLLIQIIFFELAQSKELFTFASPFIKGERLKLADVVKLVDTPDLGSGAVRYVGSSPSIRTELEGGA